MANPGELHYKGYSFDVSPYYEDDGTELWSADAFQEVHDHPLHIPKKVDGKWQSEEPSLDDHRTKGAAVKAAKKRVNMALARSNSASSRANNPGNPSRDPQEVWDYLSADEQRALKRDAKAKWSPHQDRFVSLGIIQVEVPKTSSDPWVATGFFGSPPDYPKVTLTPLGERVRTVGKRKSNPGPSAGATASDLVRKLKF